MLKVLKQCSISNLFSTLAYKRIKIKLAERISATARQENGRENNRRNVEQF